MRVTHSLILLLAAAIAASGCARQQPVAQCCSGRVPPGIDNVVYGPAAMPAPVIPTRPVAAAPLPATAIAYAPTADEGPYTLDAGDCLRVVVFG